MKLSKNQGMNLVIISLILFLLYSNNVFLHSSLGKLILLVVLVFITMNTNKFIGLGFAIVSIVLLNDGYNSSFYEGMENKEDGETKTAENESGTDSIQLSLKTENEETGYTVVEDVPVSGSSKEIINNEPERNMKDSKEDVDITANVDAMGDNSGETDAPAPNEPAVVETFANYM